MLVSAMHGQLIQRSPSIGSRPPGYKITTQLVTYWVEVKGSGTQLDRHIHSSEKRMCTKTARHGVAIQAQVLNRNRNDMASELTVGSFVVFDKSDDEVEPIWIGIIMSNLQ